MENISSELEYDGSVSELYKLYLLNLLLTIITLGTYHFWAKTRKRRYIASSLQLQHDRFEYTGYGSELFYALLFGLLILAITSTPLFWSIYTLSNIKSDPIVEESLNTNEENAGYHIEKYDHFKKNKIIIDFKSITNFWIVVNHTGFIFNYQNETLKIEYLTHKSYGLIDIPLEFKPKERIDYLIAVLLIPIYLIFFIIVLPFIVAFGSLKYRASRLRWRGIRGDLQGSSILYALNGLFQTLLKIITLGFWIPISDYKLLTFKLNKMYFGQQLFCFKPDLKKLIYTNLACIGASFYIILLMYAASYFLLPWIANYTPSESMIVQNFFFKITEKGYVILVMLLIWICYFPRYWYRAALLREKYNALSLGHIRFHCNASGKSYFKLFVFNDLLFIMTLGLALPIIWHRRMKFISQHITVIGDPSSLEIKQALGEKTKFGGGLASIMNLDIGLI